MREATRAGHDALESLLRLDGAFGLDHYAGVLWGFAAFLPPWEQQLRAALPAPLRAWFDARRRAPLVQQDLRALGLEAAGAAKVAPLVPLPTAAAAFGSLYVMEGSALGGQLISRGLAERHGIVPTNGGAYFFGAGPGTGALWREFRGLLERNVTTPEACEQACTAAVQTFDALAATFRLHLPSPLPHEPSAA
ncbi:biliverdin-producing heme oxygenase [Ramlibacter tataouinensis]|uniref:biliverdin-producing heme oxygenase n=1 Tax=Ramlibacter tataouinensis TaxID=94132 RepID=UPI0002F1234E|nr:biliverdin-producing heme oxygenase [Ramlibacter tataouinensis]